LKVDDSINNPPKFTYCNFQLKEGVAWAMKLNFTNKVPKEQLECKLKMRDVEQLFCCCFFFLIMLHVVFYLEKLND